ncbi:MAG: YsnF/AvaK domain-containing protein [Chloroflexota bacterium]
MPKNDPSNEDTTPGEQHLLGKHTAHHDVAAKRQDSGATVELREEELSARKTSVEAGRVRVGTEVTSSQQTLDVPVTHEEVTIERHAVDRSPADGQIGDQSETLTVAVSGEQVSVDKRSVVYEEVGLGKQKVVGTQQVTGTVRKEVVDVDAEGDVRTDQSRR